MLPSHPSLGRFWNISPQPPQYLSLYPYVWGVLVTHTKNRPGLVRLGAFCGPSYSFPVSLFGNGIGIEIEIGFATEFEIGIGAEIATVPEPEIGIEIEIGIGAGVVIEIGVAIAIASRVVTGFVIGIVIEIVIAPVVRLNGLFYYGSSYCVGNWWGHGEGCSLGLSPRLMALGEGRCPHSASIL